MKKKYILSYFIERDLQYWEAVIPFEAESVTEIELLILAGVENWNIGTAQYKEISERRSKFQDIQEYYAQLDKIRTDFSLGYLVLGEYKIEHPDSLFTKNNINSVLEDIKIYQLEDWFEKNKPERVTEQ